MQMGIVYLFSCITILSVLAILIGMIKPAWVSWWEKKEKANRKKVLLVYVIIFVVSVIITNLVQPKDIREKANNYSLKYPMQKELAII